MTLESYRQNGWLSAHRRNPKTPRPPKDRRYEGNRKAETQQQIPRRAEGALAPFLRQGKRDDNAEPGQRDVNHCWGGAGLCDASCKALARSGCSARTSTMASRPAAW